MLSSDLLGLIALSKHWLVVLGFLIIFSAFTSASCLYVANTRFIGCLIQYFFDSAYMWW